ncbi:MULTISPECIES: hypothetical protein [Nostoc]|nr:MULTISPECIES: hypothetical protein [Nostoc]
MQNSEFTNLDALYETRKGRERKCVSKSCYAVGVGKTKASRSR